MTSRSDLVTCPECGHIWLGDWAESAASADLLRNAHCPSCLACLTEEELEDFAVKRLRDQAAEALWPGS